jgi:hypothetical protein
MTAPKLFALACILFSIGGIAWLAWPGICNAERLERERQVKKLFAARKPERVRTRIISEDREQIIGDGACGWTDLKPSNPRTARIRDMEEVRGV